MLVVTRLLAFSNFIVFGLYLVVGPSLFYHFDFSPLSSLVVLSLPNFPYLISS